MTAFRKITSRKSFLVLVFLGFFCASGRAQNRTIDSLDRLILASVSDTQRIRLTMLKAGAFSEINLDSSIALSRQALAASVAAGYKKGMAGSRTRLASNFCFKGEYDSARFELAQSSVIAAEIKDSAMQAFVANVYGMFYGMQGKYDSSIGYFLQSAGLAAALRDTPSVSSAYRNLANSFQMQSRFTDALKYAQMALTLSEAKKDLRAQAYLQLNLGMIYNGIFDSVRAEQNFAKSIALAKELKMATVELYAETNLSSILINAHRFQEAYQMASEAKKLARQIGDPGMEATNTSRMAIALGGLNRMPEAMPLAAEAVSLAEKSKQNFNLFQACMNYGDLLMQQQKFGDAIPWYERGFATMKGSDLFDYQFSLAYTALSEAYEKTGRFREALGAFQSATKIRDSIQSKENVRKTTENALSFDFQKKEQVAKLQREKEEQAAKNRQRILIAGLMFTVLLALAAWYAFSIKKKSNSSLEKQKVALENALADLKDAQAKLIESEKMASLGELTAGIAHEIQNPLNFVNNFSEVSVELLEELKTAVAENNQQEVAQISADLDGNLAKIITHGKRADAIVKGMLQHSRRSSDQKELTDLNALADEYLRLSYHGLRAKNKSFNANLHTDFDPSLDRTAVVPQDIGRVVLNLLTNAFYAVDEKQKKELPGYLPSVWISTRKTGQSVCISVRDNGDGIPEKIREKMFQPFFTTKPTGQGTGLGLSLSYDIIKNHGGEIRVESTEGEGTLFSILLPYQPELPQDPGSKQS